MTTYEQAREVVRWCRLLAECSETTGAITRTFLSAPMHEVHDRLSAWMARAGMTVRVDAVGNIRGVYPAAASPEPSRAARLFIGSHLDTVPNAGAFDGVLGVVLAVALVEMLDGRRFPFGIEVVGFSDEEGVRFGVPFVGSRVLAGTFERDVLGLRDGRDQTMEEVIREFGLDPQRIEAEQAAGAIGYLEFHIEQGPVLDNLNLPLAVVDTVVGQSRVDIAFTGVAGHAGTTPMKARRDALACAAVWISEVEREANLTAGLVATVGRLDVEPGAGNVVPGRCRLSLDARHPDDRVRTAAVARLKKAAHDIALRRGLETSWEQRLDEDSVPMDAAMASILDRALERAGFPAHRMPSGAGHDAVMLAGRMPVGMVFLRCANGISHHPDESVRVDDVAAALDAGLQFLDELARAPSAAHAAND
jgi:allantoate deiminase